MRVFNCVSQESFRVFNRCLTSLMQIAFFQAKNDYFSDINEVVPEENAPKSFVCFALAANGAQQPPHRGSESQNSLQLSTVLNVPKNF